MNWLLVIPFVVAPLMLVLGVYIAIVSARRARHRAHGLLQTAAAHLGLQMDRAGVYVGHRGTRQVSLRLAPRKRSAESGFGWGLALETDIQQITALAGGYAHCPGYCPGADFAALFESTSRNAHALTAGQKDALLAFVRHHHQVFVEPKGAGYRAQYLAPLEVDLQQVMQLANDLATLAHALDEAPAPTAGVKVAKSP